MQAPEPIISRETTAPEALAQIGQNETAKTLLAMAFTVLYQGGKRVDYEGAGALVVHHFLESFDFTDGPLAEAMSTIGLPAEVPSLDRLAEEIPLKLLLLAAEAHLRREVDRVAAGLPSADLEWFLARGEDSDSDNADQQDEPAAEPEALAGSDLEQAAEAAKDTPAAVAPAGALVGKVMSFPSGDSTVAVEVLEYHEGDGYLVREIEDGSEFHAQPEELTEPTEGDAGATPQDYDPAPIPPKAEDRAAITVDDDTADLPDYAVFAGFDGMYFVSQAPGENDGPWFVCVKADSGKVYRHDWSSAHPRWVDAQAELIDLARDHGMTATCGECSGEFTVTGDTVQPAGEDYLLCADCGGAA